MQRTGEAKKDYKDRLKLEAVISSELNDAEGGDSDELQANRAKALEYYFGRPRGDEIEDRSTVISMDVADMINSTLAMIVPMLSTDAVVEFEPDGEEDDNQAKAESDVVNDVIIEDNNGYMEIQEAIKDALLLKNGCMNVTVEENEDVQVLNVAGGSDEELAMFIMQLEPNQIAQRDGDDLTVVTTKRRFLVNAIPIENISYQAGFVGRFQDLRFFSEMIEYTRSDLVELGIPKKVVYELPMITTSGSEAAQIRNIGYSDMRDAHSKDMEIIECHECYQRIDLDGDGIAERYRVLMAGRDVVLSYAPADLIPYSLGSPFLNPHRITGESLYDHLKATQDVKTDLRRQLLDNVALILNGRYIYDPASATEDDILNPIAGGGIRARNPQQVIPLMIPDVQTGLLAQLQYEDKVRSERGGASLDLMGSDAQLVGDTAHGIERQYGSREALAAMITRNLSESLIKGIYLLTHELMRRFANETYTVRINGKVTAVNPSEWPERKRINVKTGMSAGERGHLQNTLSMHIQSQSAAMAQGLNGILASPETIYRSSMDLLRLAGVDNPERHMVNPESEAAQEVVQQNAQQAQQAQQLAAQQQQQIQQLMAQLEQAKLAEDARQADDKIELDYYKTDVDAAVAEAKISGQGVIDLERDRINGARDTNGEG